VLPQGKAASPLLLVLERLDKEDKDLVTDESPVFGQDAKGTWRRMGVMHLAGCPAIREALRQGSRHRHDRSMTTSQSTGCA
jgi:hypothetical protein